MRRSLLFGLILVLFSPAATGQTFEVTDRVRDATGVRRIASADLRPLPGDSYPGSHAAFRAVYESDSGDDATWSLTVFGYTADTTTMSRANTVRFRTDTTSVEPRRVESKVRRLDASLVEITQIVLSKPAFATVARADRVVLSVGPAAFPMSRVLRTDLRLILDRVAGPDSPQASQVGAADTSGTDPNGQ
jgi:hypothetical protein